MNTNRGDETGTELEQNMTMLDADNNYNDSACTVILASLKMPYCKLFYLTRLGGNIFLTSRLNTLHCLLPVLSE
jgi:hypothetical protein